MTWKEYFKENSDKMPKEFVDKEITVEDCLKIIDGMSFTIKELFDKKKWHTGKPDKGGMFLVYLIDGTYDIYQFGEEYKAWDIGFRDVVAWQKIEPYKGE